MNIEDQNLKLHPWPNNEPVIQTPLQDWLSNLQFQQSLPDDEFKFDFDDDLDLTDDVRVLLKIII